MRPTYQLSTESSAAEIRSANKSSKSLSHQQSKASTKTPFQAYPQKPIWVSEQESVNNEDDEMPKLVVYRDPARSNTLNQYTQLLQQSGPRDQNIPKKPSRSISRTERSPRLTEKKKTYSQIIVQSPEGDRPLANHRLTELMESNQKLQENFTKKEEDPIEIRTKPQIILKDQSVQKKSHYESEKLIEEFLRNLSPQLNYQEIENLSDAMVEKQIQNCDDEKIVLANRIKQLKTETKPLTRNDIKYKYLNSEIELLSDKLLLTEKVINLFRDKLTLRAQIQNQKTLLNQLGDRIIQMETRFTEQIHQLKTYNATLPTERERNLEIENKKLQNKLDQEYLLRQELENGIQVNISTFQNLFNEAEQAKKHIIDQLKFVKDKRDDLNHQLKLAEEMQQVQPKSQNKTEQGQSQKVGFSFLNPQQSHRHSIAHQMQGSVMSSSSSKQQSTAGQQHLSKLIQKNVLQSLQAQESFVKSDRNPQNNVLSGLNQPEAKQTYLYQPSPSLASPVLPPSRRTTRPPPSPTAKKTRASPAFPRRLSELSSCNIQINQSFFVDEHHQGSRREERLFGLRRIRRPERSFHRGPAAIQEEYFDADKIVYSNHYPLEGSCCWKTRPNWQQMPDRTIITNIQDKNLPNNEIRTAKYTPWSFIPLNLMEQFSKMANVYFLIIGYLETIRAVSITDGKPVIWFPLFVVVSISALKDYLEDSKRSKSDDEENNKQGRNNVLCDGELKKVKWKDVLVGDIIRVEENQYFPADIVLLKCSDSQCFVETKNLDGETNLKIKKVHKGLKFLENSNDFALWEQRLLVHYQKPNPYLYQFEGYLQLADNNPAFSESESQQSNAHQHSKKVPLTDSHFILRGCSLRNTKFVYGLVSYNGHDTKILLNSTKARPKQSHLEQYMNFFIILVFFIQLVLCLFSAQYSTLQQNQKQSDMPYLEIEPENENVIVNLLTKWGTWLLIFTNFVPISLLVTLEMVKFIQGIVISRDKKCQSNDFPTTVQTSSLNEELGQVGYVFSDKTGTITRNLMEFKACSIQGKSYGEEQDLAQEDLLHLPKVSNVDFRDSAFFEDLEDKNNHEIIENFMLHLAICHSIIIEKKDGELVYNASSPDELALVNAAKFCGFEYRGTDQQGYMIIQMRNKVLRVEVLHLLEFTSTRKRMSVIVRLEDGTIKLLTKGADTVLEKLLVSKQSVLKEVTWNHLEKYAQKGLRTLLICERVVSGYEYEEWVRHYKEAQVSMQNRDEAVQQAQADIEINLQLIGATAVEDKLQDNVELTIKSLLRAGIKVWILTGDKIETAINICYSCGLLNDTQVKIMVDGESEVEVQISLNQGKSLLTQQYGSYALIISGDALIYLTANARLQDKLMEIAQQCNAVVACRVSPKQKQEIVSFVMESNPNITTLSVGDGANDVNMITAANIGVGIKGVEGNQASRAADYVVGEFQVLRHLLLYHGRECFRRNQALVGYNFYKNLVVVLPHFWYCFRNYFSPINLYDPWLFQFYNMFYTSLPIVIYSVFDQEYSDTFLMRHPELYQTTTPLSLMTFFSWFLEGIIQSGIIIVACFPTMESTAVDSNGQLLFLASVGMAVFCYAIIVANLKITVFSHSYTYVCVATIAVSILLFFLTYLCLSFLTTRTDISNTFFHLIFNFKFWCLLLIILTTTILLDLALWRWKLFSDQTLVEVQEDPAKTAHFESAISINPTIHSSRLYQDEFADIFHQDQEDSHLLPPVPVITRKYTGFAFSQQEKVLDDALKQAEN